MEAKITFLLRLSSETKGVWHTRLAWRDARGRRDAKTPSPARPPAAGAATPFTARPPAAGAARRPPRLPARPRRPPRAAAAAR